MPVRSIARWYQRLCLFGARIQPPRNDFVSTRLCFLQEDSARATSHSSEDASEVVDSQWPAHSRNLRLPRYPDYATVAFS